MNELKVTTKQYVNKAALAAEIERRISVLKANESVISMLAGGMFVNEFKDLLSFIDTLEVKEVDLDEAANDYAHDFVHDDVFETFIAGAKWQKEHPWKPADGDDLPEIDKEVIALIEAFGHYKVIFAHRVDENAEIHTSIDGKPLVLHPKKHGKGGWNIPDVKFWLDCELPKMEE